MKVAFLTMASAGLLLTSAASADVLYDNGTIVTHPGAGLGGADVSMASSVPNSSGSNVTATVWRADDFMVGGPGWSVDTIQAYSHDTGNPSPRFGEAEIQIRRGSAEGPTVGTASATWELAGINRVFNGAANLTNTDRQVNIVTADFGGLDLDPDTYWMVVSISNTAATNNWMPYVMDINPQNANDPITRVGNSMVSTDSGVTFSTTTVATGEWNNTPELPFLVNGSLVPEPSSALAGLAAGALLLRRRRA